MSAISFLIPTYSRPDLTIQCVNSILNQKIDDYDYEIIVHENPSDNELNHDELTSLSNKILYHKHEFNVGPFKNWISLLKAAKNDVVLLIFSDDLLFNFNLHQSIYLLIKSGELPFSICSVSISAMTDKYMDFKDDVYSLDNISNNLFIDFLKWSSRLPVSPGSSFFNKSIILNSFESYSKKFSFGFDNGAGPDLYTFLYSLSNIKIVNHKIKNKTKIIFRGHNDSLTLSKQSSVSVFKNYFFLRYEVIKEYKFSFFLKFQLLFNQFFTLGSFSIQLVYNIFRKLTFSQKIGFIFCVFPIIILGWLYYKLFKNLIRVYFF